MKQTEESSSENIAANRNLPATTAQQERNDAMDVHVQHLSAPDHPRCAETPSSSPVGNCQPHEN